MAEWLTLANVDHKFCDNFAGVEPCPGRDNLFQLALIDTKSCPEELLFIPSFNKEASEWLSG